jgi:hypothetical protein
MDFDIRQISSRGLQEYVESVIPNELPESFWTGMLPQFMDTSSIGSPYFLCYQAAQAKLGDKGFLSRDITVMDLLLNRADVHHIYPRQHLKVQGVTRGVYNQIANYVIAAKRDQYRDWWKGSRCLLQGTGRTVHWRSKEVRRDHRSNTITCEP